MDNTPMTLHQIVNYDAAPAANGEVDTKRRFHYMNSPMTLHQIVNYDAAPAANGEVDTKCRFHYMNSNDELQEIYLAPCAGHNVAEVLLYAHDILELFEPIDFNTGEAPFLLFCLPLLSGAALMSWHQVYGEIPNGTVLDWDLFCLTVIQWVNAFPTKADQTDLLAYLRSNKLRKPHDLSCQQVYALTIANAMVDPLAEVEASLNEQHLKQAYSNLMPLAWWQRFESLGY
jgi:hypothetical protein